MLSTIQILLVTVIGIGVLVATAIAFTDAVRRPERAFSEAGKRTKKFWSLVLGAGLLVAVLCAVRLISSVIFNLAALVPAAAYWYDVRPELPGSGASARAKLAANRQQRKAAKLPRKVKVPDYYDPADWDK